MRPSFFYGLSFRGNNAVFPFGSGRTAPRPVFSLSQRQNALFDGGDRRHQHAGAGLLPRSRFMSRQARAMMHMTGKVVPRKMLVESSMR